MHHKEASVRSHAIAPAIIKTTMAGLVLAGAVVGAQNDAKPTNDLPNPYQSVENYFKLPEGRKWGSTSAIDVDKDGKSIWVAERCGSNSCLDRASGQMSPSDPILHFDASGKLIKSFGAGMLIFPHGIHVDKDGNVWVTDGQDNGPTPQRGGGGGREAGAAPPAPTGPIGPPAGATKGNQVYKFSPDGKVLLTLGKPGGAASPDYFYQPNDVVTAPNGDIFVSEGHGRGNNRVLKFDKTGKFIKQVAKGTGGPTDKGTGPGEWNLPHKLAVDADENLYIIDREGHRLEVFDKNLNYLREIRNDWNPWDVNISRKGTESFGWIADHKDERVLKFSLKDGTILAKWGKQGWGPGEFDWVHGIVVDSKGAVYAADTYGQRLQKFIPTSTGSTQR
jgi:hypothetical protein